MKRHKTTDAPGAKAFQRGDVTEAVNKAKEVKLDFTRWRRDPSKRKPPTFPHKTK